MKLSYAVLYSFAGMIAAAQPVLAQRSDDGAGHPTWSKRVSASAHIASYTPAGNSEVFSLIDRALQTRDPLGPALIGGELRVRMLPRWNVLLGAESGRQSVASISRATPAPGSDPVRQQTTLHLSMLPYAGVEWRELRWAGTHTGEQAHAADRVRVLLGAGGGLARYRLRQWGGFVDAERAVEFEGDYTSSGHGMFAFASAGLEVPLHHRLALRGELRRQFGSAPMIGDYAEFDHFDLGGTRFSVGVQIH